MYLRYQKIFSGFTVLIIALCTWFSGTAQVPSKPNVTDACFVDINEAQNISVTVDGPSYPDGTSFVLRLSNKTGGFNTNSIIVAETQNIGDNIDFLDFSYPTIDGEGTTLASDEYRLRVELKSDDTIRSVRSDEFSAYFYDGTNLELNPRVLCEFGQLRAVPDDLPVYIWHRITNAGDQIIVGENGNTIDANIEGSYYYTPPLGNCAGFLPEARSNLVRVFAAAETAVQDFSISISSGSTPFCAEESSITLTSSVTNPAFFYQWIRDGEALAGENGTSITVSDINSEGEYRLEISDDLDRSTERCAKQSQNFIFIDLNNPFASFPNTQELIVVDLPGVDEILTAEITGQDPKTITWLKDDVEIPGSNSTSILSSGPGEYKVRVTGSSCTTFNEDTTEEFIQVIAIDNLNITIDYDNQNYTDCALNRIGLRIASITSEVNGATVNILTSNFAAEDIKWFNNGTELTQFLGPNILIDDAGGNGNYTAEIDLGGANIFASNILPVKLSPGELSIEASTLVLDEDNTSATLTVPLADQAILSLYTYRWFRVISFSQEEEISTSSTVQIIEPGSYVVEVTFDDCPSVRLNAISISSASLVIPNIITPNGFNNTKWKLPVDYTNNPNINVQIISSSGKEVLNQTSYSGNWPDEELTESIYYYIISENNSPLEKGSITIIR